MRRWLGRPAIFAVIAAVIVVAAIHVRHAMPGGYALQQDFLRDEIVKLDAELGEVKDLPSVVGEFLSRKSVIETLERDRNQGLRLLNEVTLRRPEGVRFVSVTFARGRLTVEGVAASETALRNFTSAVAASSLLQAPEGLVTRGLDFSFQTALRAVKEP